MSDLIRLFVSDIPGQRLDVYLANHLSDISRTRIQNLIRDGYVNVDGNTVKKCNFTLARGHSIHITIPTIRESEIKPENILLDIIYENSDVIVINKPVGMVVHPAAGHSSGTLVNAVLNHTTDLGGIGGDMRPGIVHRLDKDTSGIILVAKNDQAHRWLVEQFKARKVDKHYMALVDGFPPSTIGKIETSIGRDPKDRKRMAVLPDAKGRPAVTEYETLRRYRENTLIKAKPKTGRTHQIRVHMAIIGCPITGDRVYGKKKPSVDCRRQLLHASQLSIMLPGEKESTTFTAPLPKDFTEILEALQAYEK